MSAQTVVPPDPGTYQQWLAARGITDVTAQVPTVSGRWALNTEWLHASDAHRQAAVKAYLDAVRARHEPTMPPGLFDLFLDLVEHADAQHEPTRDGCHPVVPDDCAEWCDACRRVRPVADDVLRAARARRDGFLR